MLLSHSKVVGARSRRRSLAVAVLVAVALSAAAPAQAARRPTTSLVSVTRGVTQGNGESVDPSTSVGGRFVAFTSRADNLVRGDTNGARDVFVRDLKSRMTTRVSVASDGTEGDASSGGAGNAISADGRYVVFWSSATNLVSGDTNGQDDVFVHDRQTGQTTRVSVASDGSQATGGLGNLERGSAISGDGRYVAFLSLSANLVPGDTNGWADVFVHDRQSGQTTRVSVASDGTQGNQHSFDPAISADGRKVAFGSSATNLVAGDATIALDVFVHDRQTGQTTLVSKATDGTQANGLFGNCSRKPSISADGRFVAFCSDSTNLVAADTNQQGDIFVHDRQTGTTTRVNVASDGTQSDDASFQPSISADGRFVAFASWADTLVPGDTNGDLDVFVRDRLAPETTRASVASDGTQSNNSSLQPSISADGRFVGFTSFADNLVRGDTNGFSDVFMRG